MDSMRSPLDGLAVCSIWIGGFPIQWPEVQAIEQYACPLKGAAACPFEAVGCLHVHLKQWGSASQRVSVS